MLSLTDKYGELLSSRVQVIRSAYIPPGSEYSLACRLTSSVSGHQGLVEGRKAPLDNINNDIGLKVAACLVSPSSDNHIPVRCYNPTTHPIIIDAGSVIGNYMAVNEVQVIHPDSEEFKQLNKDSTPLQTSTNTSERQPVIPEHLQTLYNDACQHCTSHTERQQLADLLTEYQDVFSSGPDDVGLTHLITHTIPVIPGTRPIKQPPRRLGLTKDQEVDRQVTELLQQGRIEPHDGAWSSPVVMVTKKDKTWRMCVDYRKLNSVTK